jgi:hypothetical protein
MIFKIVFQLSSNHVFDFINLIYEQEEEKEMLSSLERWQGLQKVSGVLLSLSPSRGAPVCLSSIDRSA